MESYIVQGEKSLLIIIFEKTLKFKLLWFITDERSGYNGKDFQSCDGCFELFKKCSLCCEINCDDVNSDGYFGRHCKTFRNDCVPKCVCKDGFVREKIDGKYVPVEEFPTVKLLESNTFISSTQNI